MRSPLRDDDFTIDLALGEKFFGIFCNIFRCNFNKTLRFLHAIFMMIFIFYDKTAAKKPKSLAKLFFWASKQPFDIRSFIASYNVCPVAIPELFAQTQGPDNWQLIPKLP